VTQEGITGFGWFILVLFGLLLVADLAVGAG
jgi:hypothetical protein